MEAPIYTEGTNTLDVLEFPKDGRKGLAVTRFEEFICVYVCHPSVLGTVEPHALTVNVGLH